MKDNIMNRPLCLGISKAGHDKGRLYVVLCRQENQYLAADGVHALISKPKRKNEKHLQRIEKLDRTVRSLLDQAQSDSDLVHVLRVFRKEA